MCVKLSVSGCEWMVLKENDKRREWERWGREKVGKYDINEMAEQGECLNLQIKL